MLILLSPAKSLDFKTPAPFSDHTLPEFLNDSAILIKLLRQLSPAQIANLMGISDTLAHLNFERFQQWQRPFTEKNAKQAAFAFNGDVYEGFDAKSLSLKECQYAQQHLRILSGLYGVLKPLDLIAPYRLEMGIKFENSRGKNLYDFWEEKITCALKAFFIEKKHAGEKVIINLASQEYTKSISFNQFDMPIITPVFEDWKNGKYKMISFYAKRARGLMARFAIVNKLKRSEDLKQFDSEGYQFDKNNSTTEKWFFRRLNQSGVLK